MEYDPPDSPYRRAADRMVVAYDLITKQRYREALDILNTAIVIAPTYPLAYKLRAVVFDHLNLAAQAEADRLRERQLATTDGYPVADVVNGVATITMRLARSGRVSRRQTRQSGSLTGRLLSPAVFGIIMLIGVIAVGLGGILLAIDTLGDGNGGAVLRPSLGASPTVAAATEVPSVTEEPNPDPTADIAGSPYSLSSVTNAWENAGLAVTNNGPDDSFEGFDNTATSFTVSGGEFAVFIYEDASSTSSDWIISGTGVPDPQPGRTFPASQSVWFNANVIVAVFSTVDGAFEAFVNMTP